MKKLLKERFQELAGIKPLYKEQDKDQYGRTQADRDWEKGINPKSSTPSKTVTTTEKQNVLIKGVNTQVTIEDKSSRNCPSELNQSCLNNVTISWDDKKFEGLEFEIADTFDSHDNEGDDTTFIAEEEQDGIKYVFAVEVSVEYNYSNSGNIQAVSWKYLEIDEIDEEQKDYDKGWYKEEELDEMNATGGGASFNAGTGMGYSTPNAFNNNDDE
jgi:hypothetical protein